MLAQLLAGLLFFALGLDRQFLAIFANSLDAHPPGTWIPAAPLPKNDTCRFNGVFDRTTSRSADYGYVAAG